MNRIAATAFALTVCIGVASGLDIKDGRMRLSLDEKTGRFAVYYLEDAAKNRYVPLLYDQETRTSYATLYFDQRQYKLGDASEFRIASVKAEGAAARIEYRSSFAVVAQTFSFAASPGASSADSMQIRFDVENTSSREAKVGLRFLFDTWLGEKQSAHFTWQGLGPAAAESLVKADQGVAWIRSSQDQDGADLSKTALQLTLAAPATVPDYSIVANWKRLNDAAWTLETNPGRNFTLLPYSINDSAVATFYEPTSIRPGASRSVTVYLGARTDGFTEPKSTQAAKPAEPTAAAPVQQSAKLDEMADLVAARTALERINEALASKATLTPAELEELRAILERLEERKGRY